MTDLNDLLYFAQVVEHGGFAAASRVTGTPKSKLSRRIAQLENRLGLRLLQRSSRRFSVTDIGRDFYEHCAAMLVEAEAAEGLAARAVAEPRGTLRVSCPVALLGFQFGDLFARFLHEHPGVNLQLEGTNRRVDVIAEGIDVAIRVRFPPLESTDLTMRHLDESTQCIVASPRMGVRADLPGDLASLPALDLGAAYREHLWHLDHVDGREAMVRFEPRLATDDMSTLRQAALAGVGIVQLPTRMIWNDLVEGTLVAVLPAWRPRSGIVHAVFPSRRGLLPSVRALVNFLARECAAQRREIQLP